MSTRSKKTSASATESAEPHVAARLPGPVEAAVAAASDAGAAGVSRDEAVRRLAYAYYERRGRADGNDLDDWLKAEAALGSSDAAP